jgi:hypothetical protein
VRRRGHRTYHCVFIADSLALQLAIAQARKCLAKSEIGQPLYATTDCEITRLEKWAIVRIIHDEPQFSEMFVAHLLARTIRVEEDLVDQLFNSSEKRLARALLILAIFGKEGRPEPVIANVSQETLAEMIGTTRSRVSHFMNKFGDWASLVTTEPWRSIAHC